MEETSRRSEAPSVLRRARGGALIHQVYIRISLTFVQLPRLLRAVGEAGEEDANIVIAVFMEFMGQQATLLDFEQRVEMCACIVGCCRKMRLCSSRVVVDALAHVTLYFSQFLPLVRPRSILHAPNPKHTRTTLSSSSCSSCSSSSSIVLTSVAG